MGSPSLPLLKCGSRTRCGWARRTAWSINGPRKAQGRASRRTRDTRMPNSSGRSARGVAAEPRSSCRTPTARRCRGISRRSPARWHKLPKPLSSSTRPAGTPPPNSRSRSTSPWCRCRQPLPNAMPRKTSGSICTRPISQTAYLPTMPPSSLRATTPGASSSKKPAASHPLQPGCGPSSVNPNEGWYQLHRRAKDSGGSCQSDNTVVDELQGHDE